MSFVRTKEIPPHSGNLYDYEVETLHDNGKVIQHHIQYLGKHGTTHNKPLLGGRSHFGLVGDNATPNGFRLPKPKVVCKHCQGQHTRKYGLYKGIQNYYCDDCNTKFTGTDALAHGRVSPIHIVNALNEFYDGMSFHDIENSIENRDGQVPK